MQLELIKQLYADVETKRIFMKCFIGTTSVVTTVYFIRKLLISYINNKKLHKKRKEVDDRKVKLFQKLQGMTLPLENIKKFCYLSGTELLAKIHSGEASAVDILEAYQANALMKNTELNFIADVIYDSDVSALMIHNDVTQSLMGWPLSVKDVFCIEKYDCTQGLTTKIFHPCLKTSTIITVLKEEGAIPFIITNVCQGLQTFESSNPIFGRTVNPFNHTMTCGGSSGGEGASLGSESSLIGIGNDAGGSIRIPASFCGVYGLKPTSSRVSSRHTDKIYFCNLIIKASIGPMARYIDDLISTFKVMTSDRVFEKDAYNPPVTFNETLLLSHDRMKIGYYTHIGGQQICPVPSVYRAVMLARKALQDAGHELVEFKLPRIDNIFEIISKAFIVDGGKRLLTDAIQDGAVDPSLKLNIALMRTPRSIKYIMSCFCRLFNKRLSEYIWAFNASSVFETWELNDEVRAYQEEVLSLLEKENIDGIICPVLPIVAAPLNTCDKISEVDIYCSVYNVLDYPAGSVPVTWVTEGDINKLNLQYPKKSFLDRQIVKLQKDSLALPVGVQCVAKPWRDETCLRIMKDISLNLVVDN